MALTLQQISDRMEITDLRVKYAAFIDARQWDDLRTIFTDDCTFDFPEVYDQYAPWSGADRVVANISEAMRGGAPFDAMHFMTNPLITLKDDRSATARWFLADYITHQTLPTASPGGHENPLIYLGVYDDEYVKAADEWKIAHVKLTFHWPRRLHPKSVVQGQQSGG